MFENILKFPIPVLLEFHIVTYAILLALYQYIYQIYCIKVCIQVPSLFFLDLFPLSDKKPRLALHTIGDEFIDIDEAYAMFSAQLCGNGLQRPLPHAYCHDRFSCFGVRLNARKRLERSASVHRK